MSLLPGTAARKPREDSSRRHRFAPLPRQVAVVSASVAAGLFTGLNPRLARADCLPNPPASGQTVVCTGPAPTTVPLDASGASDVTVNINAGAVITGDGTSNLITLGAGAQLSNLGRIEPLAGTIGVVALGDNSTLRNFGTVATNGFNALSFASIGTNNVLRNELGGTITISGDLAAGMLASNSEGNSLINAGRITLNTFQGGGLFVQASNRAVLTNTATGVIESNLDQAFGISATGGTGHTLRNDGSIVTRGQASHGMLLNETTNSSMINGGAITTSGGSSETENRAYGMFAFGGQGNTLQNLAGGVITASGIGSSGMEVAEGTGNLLRNEGTLNVSGTGAHGLYVLSGAGNTLDNRGTVNTSGQRGNGLRADDGDTTFINSGELLVGGRDAFGVFMQGNNNTLVNSGTIRASGANADGVLSNTVAGGFVARIENTGSIVSERGFAVRGVNGQETLVNAGLVRSDAGTAIDLRGGNDMLILRTGSQINGLADGGTGTDGVTLEGAGTAANAFANFESLRMTGTDWTLSGSGTFNDTQVENGVLRINGTLASARTTVQNGATLGGTGRITGSVTVQDGGHVAPGASPGTLTIGGDLSLSAGSALDYEFGQANVPGGPLNDLMVVGGNLLLDGTLNVTQSAAGAFGPGVYRVINYGGALNDQGLNLGTLPGNGGPYFVQTSVANQVNLVNTQGLALTFWDGNASTLFNNAAVNGGTGRWLASPANDAWTESTGTVNAPWKSNGFAIFQGTPGMVTVDNGAGPVIFSGAQFAVDGYTITGQPLTTTTAETFMRVGDGTAAGAEMTATIGAVIQGSGGLAKTDLGTLVLTGANTFSGNVAVLDGTLSVRGGAINAPAATLLVANEDAGTLRIENGGVVGNFVSVIGQSVGGQGAAIVTGSGSTWTSGEGITVGDAGAGALNVESGGAVRSAFALAARQASGQATIKVTGNGSSWTTPGFLSLLSGTSTMTIEQAGLVRGGSVVIGENAGAQATVVVNGPGSTLASDTTFEVARSGIGSLTVSGGATATSAQGFVGRVAGGVGNAVVTGTGSRWVNTGPDLTIGNGGTGTLTISEGATVSAPAIYLAYFPGSVGTLNIGAATSLAPAGPGRLDTPTLALGDGTATVNFNHDAPGYEFTALMSGTGTVNALAGTTILLADNTYAGGTTIAAPATLQLGRGGTTGSFRGDVANDGTLAFARSDALTFSGLISGAGRVVQQGSGTVTLAPARAGGNSYAGGTVLQQGVLAMPADNVLGAPSGGVTFDGGTLQWLGSFELSATRPVAIESGGATLDTQGYEAIVAQGITGAGAMTKTGAGTLILQGASTFGGGTTVRAGTLVVGDSTRPGAALGGGGTVVVQAGATLGGYGSVTGDVVNDGVLKVADAIATPAIPGIGNGGFTINGTLRNAGLAQIGAVNATPGNRLTVNSYVGAPGSRVTLNAFLGADNSPSDRLVINGGSASGASTLQITNAGGGGALTTGDGIVVVDAANGATTAGSAFALGGARAAAGAYEYLLYRGGTSNGQSWYLRSTLPSPPGSSLPASAASAAEQPVASSPAPAAAGSPQSAAPTVLLPNYRVEVPLDMALPVLGNRLGITMLGTYHDRAGEENFTATSEGPRLMGAWGRLFGTNGETYKSAGDNLLDRLGDFTRNGPSHDYKETGVQTGIDLLRRLDASGQGDVAGTYIAVGHTDSNVNAIYGGRAGTASMDGYALGGYWTRKGTSGWYVDGVLQGTRYDNVKTQSVFAEAFSTDGWGVAASLEGGYPLSLAPGWALEPQGQLVYQWTKFDDSADRMGRISFDDTSTLYGRIGARLTHRIAQDEGSQDLTAWARLNIWHAFDSDATTTFASLQGTNPVALGAPLGASTWAQIGIGLAGQISRNASAFGSVDYNRSLDSDDSHGWGGRVGVRFKW